MNFEENLTDDEVYAAAEAADQQAQDDGYADVTVAEFYGEAFMAQYDDDPSPYSGDYSEM